MLSQFKKKNPNCRTLKTGSFCLSLKSPNSPWDLEQIWLASVNSMNRIKAAFKRWNQNSSDDREFYKSKFFISVPMALNTSKPWVFQNIPGPWACFFFFFNRSPLFSLEELGLASSTPLLFPIKRKRGKSRSECWPSHANLPSSELKLSKTLF